jgi:hypothetical protein
MKRGIISFKPLPDGTYEEVGRVEYTINSDEKDLHLLSDFISIERIRQEKEK